MRRYAEPLQDRAPERTGRPPSLSRADEWELYCYRKSGMSIKGCASFFRVSVPTANRIIAKFKAYDDRAEPIALEFRGRFKALREPEASMSSSVNSVAERESGWRLVVAAADQIGKLVTDIPGEPTVEAQRELSRAAVLLQQVIPMLERARDRESERKVVAHG